MKIEDSVALVTGANRGLGKALVDALLAKGAAKVYACARDPRTLTHRDARIVPLRLDTSKADELAAVARAAPDVSLLVNNAGTLTSFGVLTCTPASIEADLRTNVLGTLAVIRAFTPVLERAGGAAIVNVLSLVSLSSFPALGGYSASKAAAYSITQAVRAELRPKQIAVLAALPGPIDTDMVKALDLPKASPSDVATGIVEGILRGDEEIFPDPMAQQMGSTWAKSPKEYERAFASL